VIASLVSPALRQRVRGLATPIALAFGKVGLSPNHLTLIGFAIAVIGAVAAAQQSWFAAGVLLIVGGVFDLFDGALARATGQASKLGAFMDSVFDRAGEGIVYVGIVAGCLAADFDLGAVLAAAAMASAFMVSYVRAKSESLGFTPGSRMAAIGLAPREVRIVLLTIGLLVTGISIAPLNGAPPAGQTCIEVCPSSGQILGATLALITALATITAIQRIVHVIRQSPQDQASQ
jgi:phosphatidylglycerophosphate synthase